MHTYLHIYIHKAPLKRPVFPAGESCAGFTSAGEIGRNPWILMAENIWKIYGTHGKYGKYMEIYGKYDLYT